MSLLVHELLIATGERGNNTQNLQHNLTQTHINGASVSGHKPTVQTVTHLQNIRPISACPQRFIEVEKGSKLAEALTGVTSFVYPVQTTDVVYSTKNVSHVVCTPISSQKSKTRPVRGSKSYSLPFVLQDHNYGAPPPSPPPTSPPSIPQTPHSQISQLQNQKIQISPTNNLKSSPKKLNQLSPLKSPFLNRTRQLVEHNEYIKSRYNGNIDNESMSFNGFKNTQQKTPPAMSHLISNMPAYKQQFMPHPKATVYPVNSNAGSSKGKNELNSAHDTDDDCRVSERSSSLGPSGEETETAPENENEEMQQDESITRCICNFTHDDGYMIQCDRCLVWQHVDCMEIDRSNIPEEYLCEACHPRVVNKSKAKTLQIRRRQQIRSNQNRSSSESDDNVKNKTTKNDRRTLKRKRAKTTKENRISNKKVVSSKLAINSPKISLLTSDQGKTNKNRKRQVSITQWEASATSSSIFTIEQVRSWIEDYEVAVTNHYSPELRAKLNSARMNGISAEFRESTQGALLGHRCTIAPCYDATPESMEDKMLIAATRLKQGTAIIEYQGKYTLKSQWPNIEPPACLPYLPFILHYSLAKEGFGICVDARTYGNDARFARRAIKYNAEICHVVERGSIHLYIVAREDIEEDYEIVLSLSTAVISPNYQKISRVTSLEFPLIAPENPLKSPISPVNSINGPMTFIPVTNSMNCLKSPVKNEKTHVLSSPESAKNSLLSKTFSAMRTLSPAPLKPKTTLPLASLKLKPASYPTSPKTKPTISPASPKTKPAISPMSPKSRPKFLPTSPRSKSTFSPTSPKSKPTLSPTSPRSKPTLSPTSPRSKPMSPQSPRNNFFKTSFSNLKSILEEKSKELGTLPTPVEEVDIVDGKPSVNTPTSEPQVGANQQNLKILQQNAKTPQQNSKILQQIAKTPQQSVEISQQNIKCLQQNVKTSQQNITTQQQNVKSPQQKIKSPQQNVKTSQHNVTPPQQSVKTSQQKVQTSQHNVKPPQQGVRTNKRSSSNDSFSSPEVSTQTNKNKPALKLQKTLTSSNSKTLKSPTRRNSRRDSEDVTDAKTSESKNDEDKKMTREERKIAAYMKAFERMEKKEQRKQSHEKRKEKENTDDSEDSEKKPKSHLKAKSSTPQKRLSEASDDCAKSGAGSGGSSSECERNKSGSEPTVVVSTPLSSPSLPSNDNVGYRFPKTKKSLMNDWLNETVDPVLHSPSYINETAPGVPTCYMRSPTAPVKKTSIIATGIEIAKAPTFGVGGEVVDALSAKKRWLRQAIIDESDGCLGFGLVSCSSPNSRPESPTLSSHLTPLKKRRIARESMSSDCTPPSTPHHYSAHFEEKFPNEVEIDVGNEKSLPKDSKIKIEFDNQCRKINVESCVKSEPNIKCRQYNVESCVKSELDTKCHQINVESCVKSEPDTKCRQINVESCVKSELDTKCQINIESCVKSEPDTKCRQINIESCVKSELGTKCCQINVESCVKSEPDTNGHQINIESCVKSETDTKNCVKYETNNKNYKTDSEHCVNSEIGSENDVKDKVERENCIKNELQIENIAKNKIEGESNSSDIKVSSWESTTNKAGSTIFKLDLEKVKSTLNKLPNDSNLRLELNIKSKELKNKIQQMENKCLGESVDSSECLDKFLSQDLNLNNSKSERTCQNNEIKEGLESTAETESKLPDVREIVDTYCINNVDRKTSIEPKSCPSSSDCEKIPQSILDGENIDCDKVELKCDSSEYGKSRVELDGNCAEGTDGPDQNVVMSCDAQLNSENEIVNTSKSKKMNFEIELNTHESKELNFSESKKIVTPDSEVNTHNDNELNTPDCEKLSALNEDTPDSGKRIMPESVKAVTRETISESFEKTSNSRNKEANTTEKCELLNFDKLQHSSPNFDDSNSSAAHKSLNFQFQNNLFAKTYAKIIGVKDFIENTEESILQEFKTIDSLKATSSLKTDASLDVPDSFKTSDKCSENFNVKKNKEVNIVKDGDQNSIGSFDDCFKNSDEDSIQNCQSPDEDSELALEGLELLDVAFSQVAKKKLSISDYRKRKNFVSDQDFLGNNSFDCETSDLTPIKTFNLLEAISRNVREPNTSKKYVSNVPRKKVAANQKFLKNTPSSIDDKSIKWSDEPTLLEQQRENLTQRLKTQFGLKVAVKAKSKLNLRYMEKSKFSLVDKKSSPASTISPVLENLPLNKIQSVPLDKKFFSEIKPVPIDPSLERIKKAIERNSLSFLKNQSNEKELLGNHSSNSPQLPFKTAPKSPLLSNKTAGESPILPHRATPKSPLMPNKTTTKSPLLSNRTTPDFKSPCENSIKLSSHSTNIDLKNAVHAKLPKRHGVNQKRSPYKLKSPKENIFNKSDQVDLKQNFDSHNKNIKNEGLDIRSYLMRQYQLKASNPQRQLKKKRKIEL